MWRRFLPVALVLLLCAVAVTASPQDAVPTDPFRIPPRKAFAVLDRLEKSSGQKLAPAADELSLFEDAADGKLDKWSYSEACLIASGVTDPARRKEYLKKLDELEAGARKTLDGSSTTAEKGERLLKFLHAGPMAKGYESEQTSLHTVLDKSRFNCVSSAVLYNVVGSRLGWELWALELPGTASSAGHVFSVLLDGDDRLDVETTNEHGFNPKRDEATLKKLQKPDGEIYDPKKHKDTVREVNALGLAAVIYYNRGVQLSKNKKHHEGVLACFAALCLDPASPSAANNARAGLTNWGNALMEAKKFEEVLNVVTVGLELAPKDDTLTNNHKVVWHKFAEHEMAAGREDAALAVVRRAATAIPGKEFVEAEADLYQREGQKLTRAGKWEEAIALAERGLTKVAEKPRKELTDTRNGLYLNWSNALAGKKEFEKAVGVLVKGLTADPTDDRLRNNAKVYALKQAEGLLAAGKDDDALAALRRAAKAVPGGSAELLEAEADLYQREVAKLSKAAKWEAAVAIAERGLKIVSEKPRKELTDTRNGVYLNWSNTHVKAKEYEKALEVLKKAMKADPKDDRFRNNSVAVYDSWAEPLMKKKDWAGAIKVYQKGLGQFPGDSHLANNLRYCEQEMKKAKE